MRTPEQKKKRAEDAARYRKRHPDRFKESLRRWRQKYPDRVRACRRKHAIKYREINAAKVSERSWKRAGIDLTENEYQELLTAQDGLCAICRKPPSRKRLHVDHSHSGGQVRGLLCNKCNFGVGQFNDSILLLEAAIAYLRVF